jgi:hypothetical protein
VPALSSSLISPALEQLQDLPAGDRLVLAGQCPSLAGYLAQVHDPRDPRGVRHTLTSLLLTAAAAVLAGTRSFTAISEWVGDAPPRVLAVPGSAMSPWHTGSSRRMRRPSAGSWSRWMPPHWRRRGILAGRPAPGRPPAAPACRRERRAVVNGKAVHGTRHASGDGQAVHLPAAAESGR